MRTFILLVTITFFSILNLAAQNSYPKETVHVKDGNKFTGYIIELIPDQSIKIKLGSENVITINWEDIVKIERDFSNFHNNSFGGNGADLGYGFVEDGDRSRLKKGYKNILEATVIAGEKNFGVSITDVNAIQFNPYLSLGLGLGVEHFNDDGISIPAFVDFRYYWFDAKVTPYVATKTGIHLNLDRSIYNQFLFNSVLGIKIDLKKSSLLLGLGYRSYDYQVYTGYGSYATSSFNGTFNAGFVF